LLDLCDVLFEVDDLVAVVAVRIELLLHQLVHHRMVLGLTP
jgi:hypothetical protein